MSTVARVRQHFLDFFTTHQHTVVPSAPVVPQNDETLLFTNAGMVPFKDFFTGFQTPPFLKAASAQKCIRAGGKHNDLEQVGYTRRHHTFFEMLGNFSFGSYFKEEAIYLAWSFIHHELNIPKDRLWVTVYHEDSDASALWAKIAGLSSDRILPIATHDNFWSMGDTGPCGPCSEIFYDHGDHLPGGLPGTAHADGDRFVEIWNLVFMQYEQQVGGKRIALPRPCIDTGMGLERISAVLQGVSDNYQIDLFRNMLTAVGDLSGTRPDQPSHKVIVDHVRSAAFIMADGVLPANEGRGYVLRRILRRAIRHTHLLGVKDIFLYKLVSYLVHEMGESYPELQRAQPLIELQMRREEERFRETLERGLKMLHAAITPLASGQQLSGDVAFQLYDTYGFPVDLTQIILQEHNVTVDMQGFEEAMHQQKEEGRKHWSSHSAASPDAFWLERAATLEPTEFIGYQDLEGPALIQVLVQDHQHCTSVEGPTEVELVTAQTPFYGTSGGQIGDTGVLLVQENIRLVVSETRKQAGLYIHRTHVPEGVTLSVGQEGRWYVDVKRRMDIRRHHSATHLLHAALRRIIGLHVTQKGSLVEPHRLRFDFSHDQPLTGDEKQRIEDEVNQAIFANALVCTDTMPYNQALKKGALALFGEKYESTVRVVAMGDEHGVESHSVELCGGTHVAQTGDMGLFLIQSESGVASGIRRIEAVVGDAALALFRQQKALLDQICASLKCSSSQVVPRVTQLIQERQQDRRKSVSSTAHCTIQQWVCGDVQVCVQTGQDLSTDTMRRLVDTYRIETPHGIICVLSISTEHKRVGVVVGIGSQQVTHYHAVDLVRQISTFFEGKGGGGRPEFAQGGGLNADKVPLFSEYLKNLIEK